MRRSFFGYLLAAGLVWSAIGCRSVRPPQTVSGPHFTVLTYNVNWGGLRPDLAADAIRKSGADIVCLQETTPEWAQYLRQSLGSEYSFTEFRDSRLRSGGGLGFLSKLPAHEVAYIPSDTGWFDGWIKSFETARGPVQVLNVHLHPPVSESGSWVSGYLSTGDDRLAEMKRFFAKRDSHWPMLVMGDFNDGEKGPAVEWLEKNKLANALPQFDSYTKTWEWKTSVITLKRRMDHILYSPELHCCAAEVLREGASDHFPVQAVFTQPTL
jgi:endonuclease/exonuclease/phosphatase family metal-dependent hydrolase